MLSFKKNPRGYFYVRSSGYGDPPTELPSSVDPGDGVLLEADAGEAGGVMLNLRVTMVNGDNCAGTFLSFEDPRRRIPGVGRGDSFSFSKGHIHLVEKVS